MNHPALGLLEFDHVTFQTSITIDLRVKVYAATPATASKLAQLLASIGVTLIKTTLRIRTCHSAYRFL